MILLDFLNYCFVIDIYFLVVMNVLRMINYFYLGLRLLVFNLILVFFCFVFRLNRLGVSSILF